MYIISNVYIQARYKKLCLVSRLCGRDKTMFYGYKPPFFYCFVNSSNIRKYNVTLLLQKNHCVVYSDK